MAAAVIVPIASTVSTLEDRADVVKLQADCALSIFLMWLVGVHLSLVVCCCICLHAFAIMIVGITCAINAYFMFAILLLVLMIIQEQHVATCVQNSHKQTETMH